MRALGARNRAQPSARATAPMSDATAVGPAAGPAADATAVPAAVATAGPAATVLAAAATIPELPTDEVIQAASSILNACLQHHPQRFIQVLMPLPPPTQQAAANFPPPIAGPVTIEDDDDWEEPDVAAKQYNREQHFVQLNINIPPPPPPRPRQPSTPPPNKLLKTTHESRHEVFVTSSTSSSSTGKGNIGDGDGGKGGKSGKGKLFTKERGDWHSLMHHLMRIKAHTETVGGE